MNFPWISHEFQGHEFQWICTFSFYFKQFYENSLHQGLHEFRRHFHEFPWISKTICTESKSQNRSSMVTFWFLWYLRVQRFQVHVLHCSQFAAKNLATVDLRRERFCDVCFDWLLMCVTNVFYFWKLYEKGSHQGPASPIFVRQVHMFCCRLVDTCG